MEALKSIWAKVVAVLGAAVGLLLYFLSLKNKQANALKAQIDLVDTQKKADLIEVDIKQKLDAEKMLKKEVADHEQALVQLEEKRKEIAQQQDNKSPKEIEDYWNKK
jgi:hypothetical protein